MNDRNEIMTAWKLIWTQKYNKINPNFIGLIKIVWISCFAIDAVNLTIIDGQRIFGKCFMFAFVYGATNFIFRIFKCTLGTIQRFNYCFCCEFWKSPRPFLDLLVIPLHPSGVTRIYFIFFILYLFFFFGGGDLPT